MRICIFKLTAVVPTLLVFTRCVCRTNMILEAVDQFAPQSAFQMLMSVVVCTFLVWYAQYHWNRRHLYRMASKFDGPMCLPFIGNGLYFVGSTRDILHNVMSVVSDFKLPVRVWLGQKLFYGVVDPEHLEIIMNSPHALEKDELYQYAEPVVGTGLFTAPLSKWKRHRKIIMPTFNQRILDEFVPVFVERSTILVDQLKNEVGKGSFNIFHYVSRCTLDIICETAMGVTVEAQTKYSDYVQWANKAMEVIFTRMFNVWYHNEFIFNLSQSAREFQDVNTKMKAFTGTVVKEKREAYQRKRREQRNLPEGYVEPPTRNTFLQQLIELSEHGAHFTDEELREEVDTFMVAGSETTASMNSFIFIMLGMYPDVQERVYQEVVDVLGPDRAVEVDDLGRFHYMERVMKETMRVFPVGPVLVRAVTKDIQLENCVIPGGSSVAMVVIKTHRNEKYWPQPFRFDPDRFLPEEVAKRHPYAWLPFSGGPRNCVGPRYAFTAMKSLIATVVRKYKFSTDYNCIEDIKLKADLVLKPVNGYNVLVKLRE